MLAGFIFDMFRVFAVVLRVAFWFVQLAEELYFQTQNFSFYPASSETVQCQLIESIDTVPD